MTYKDLYYHRQDLPSYVKRTQFLRLAEEFSGSSAVPIISGRITTDIIRGIFLPAEVAAKTRYRNVADGKCLIVIARGNNECWRRLVSIKESMHLFDNSVEKTATAVAFERLLYQLRPPGTMEQTLEMRSEIKSFWMGLGLVCKESERAEYTNLRANGDIKDIDIANKLRIPEQHVPDLCGERYGPNIEILLRES